MNFLRDIDVILLSGTNRAARRAYYKRNYKKLDLFPWALINTDKRIEKFVPYINVANRKKELRRAGLGK